MEIFNIIKNRRSIRKFTQQEVPQDLIEKLIEAGAWAPSACNAQGWRFIVVRDEKVKKEIVKYGGSVTIGMAPVAIIVIYDNRTKNLEYQDHIQSAAAAIENILLAAGSLGLTGSWICHLPSQRTLRKILKIPASFSPIACIILGYQAKEPLPVVRRYPLEKIVSYNKFGENLAQEKVNETRIFFYRIFRKCYLLLPSAFKKGFLNKLVDRWFVKKFDN